MTPEALLTRLEFIGATLEPRLRYSGVPENLVPELQRNKFAVIALLLRKAGAEEQERKFKPQDFTLSPVNSVSAPPEGWIAYWRSRGQVPESLSREELERMADEHAQKYRHLTQSGPTGAIPDH